MTSFAVGACGMCVGHCRVASSNPARVRACSCSLAASVSAVMHAQPRTSRLSVPCFLLAVAMMLAIAMFAMGTSTSAVGEHGGGGTVEQRYGGHRTILGKQRVVIVGDVHGMFDEMLQLLERVKYKPATDTLVFTGDVGNKGPQTGAVVEWIRGAQARGDAVDAVLGNHDRYVIGGGKSVARASGVQRAWLAERPLSITIANYDTVVVHAGVLPGVALEDQRVDDLTTMRNVLPETMTGTKRADVGVPWIAELDRYYKSPEGGVSRSDVLAGRHVVFGHDAVRGVQRSARATGIDTGCVYGDQLTALVLPTRELMSVSCREIAPKTITDPKKIPKNRAAGEGWDPHKARPT